MCLPVWDVWEVWEGEGGTWGCACSGEKEGGKRVPGGNGLCGIELGRHRRLRLGCHVNVNGMGVGREARWIHGWGGGWEVRLCFQVWNLEESGVTVCRACAGCLAVGALYQYLLPAPLTTELLGTSTFSSSRSLRINPPATSFSQTSELASSSWVEAASSSTDENPLRSRE